MKEFDIIRHPIKVRAVPLITKINNAYEVQYIENILFICSTTSIYLHIELVENGGDGVVKNHIDEIQENISKVIPKKFEIKIHGYGKKLFTIKNPFGFKTFDNQKEQFNEILCNFHNHEITDNLAVSLLKNEQKHKFNLYLPDEGNNNPILNYDFTNLQANKTTEKYTIYYKFLDLIPSKPSVEYLNLLKNKDPGKFNDYYNFLKEQIQFNKILSSSFIKNFKLPTHLNSYTLKKYLPLFAYYAITGPWKKLWIKFGFDPKKDKKIYKFQRVPIRKFGKSSQLINFPDLITEIEKKPLKYLQDECEYERGFIKQEGIELIKRYLNEKIITKTTFDDTSSESEASDFDILI